MLYLLKIQNLLFLTTLIISTFAVDIELTILLPANERECFHEVFQQGKTIEVEYEVLTGGEMDINFWVYSPSSRVIQSDFKKRDDLKKIKTEETGIYQFCFDNTISRFSQKQIYFSVRVINEQGHNENDRVTQSWMNDIDRDDLGDLQSKVEQIRETFQRIWDNMESAQRYQKAFNNYELVDRVIAENNFERVNFWSIIHLIAMVSVSVVQVITIRSLFEAKSAYGKLLRGKK